MRNFCIYLEGDRYSEDGYWCALSGEGCDPFDCELLCTPCDLGGDIADREWAERDFH